MRDDKILKGLIVGAVGGLLAAWVMNQFQSGISALKTKLKSGEEEGSSQQGEDATQKTAEAIAEKVFHRKAIERTETAMGDGGALRVRSRGRRALWRVGGGVGCRTDRMGDGLWQRSVPGGR